jgi:N-acetylmuramic acid 6-phosphate (MurNAc-6-P) etherase
MSLPITEETNSITSRLDKAGPKEIVQLFSHVDSQLFTGYSTFPSIFDKDILSRICKLADAFRDAETNGTKVIFSGCGTSGRLAYVCAHNYNGKSTSETFQYLIAGGDKALVKSEELAEDKPDYGRNDLSPYVTKGEKFVLVGISCGISAPYIAGQLEYCPTNADAYLIGFNPLELTRKAKIPTWDKSFGEFCKEGKFTIINPVVGPESITGSSRLKGGSMTKIILDTCFILSKNFSKSTIEDAKKNLLEFSSAALYTYSHMDEISSFIKSASSAKRIVYRSEGMDAGMFGFLDASECPPTFGCDFEDVRGFIKNGWKQFKNRDGDLSKHGPQYQFDNYESRDGDAVFNLDIKEGRQVVISQNDQTFCISLDFLSNPVEFLAAQFALKIVLNLISSGTFILRGMVFENRMINLRVSNRKLYDRAIGIVEHVAKTDKKTAEQLLLHSIWKHESTGDVESSIIKAQKMNFVVPVAVRLARMDLSEALKDLPEFK